MTLDRQPVGANGTELGVVALVTLKVSIEGTDITLQVPCYVLNSNKPLWNGELWNCGLVLGTNCLEKFGFFYNSPQWSDGQASSEGSLCTEFDCYRTSNLYSGAYTD